MAFFGGEDSLSRIMAENGNNPAWAVDVISRGTLGAIGSVLAMLGVVAAPITSGDTAFRSARLMIADIFNIDQRPLCQALYDLPAIVCSGIRHNSWSTSVYCGVTSHGPTRHSAL